MFGGPQVTGNSEDSWCSHEARAMKVWRQLLVRMMNGTTLAILYACVIQLFAFSFLSSLTASVFQNEFLVSRSEPEAHSNWCALHLVSGAAAESQSMLASRKESSQIHITHPMRPHFKAVQFIFNLFQHEASSTSFHGVPHTWQILVCVNFQVWVLRW